MKKLILLTVLVCLLVGAIGVGAYFYPYYAYVQTLASSHFSSWYHSVDHGKNIYIADKISFDQSELSDDGRKWKTFHVGNWTFPLPIFHPLFTVMPRITSHTMGHLELGFTLLDTNGKVLFSFEPSKNTFFTYHLEDQRIFRVPICREILSKPSTSVRWEEIYSKDIKKWKIPYEELLHNLHIFYLRSIYFHKDTTSFYYYPEKKYGITRRPSKDKDLKKEHVSILRNGVVYNFSIWSRLDHKLAERYRDKFLKAIKFTSSSTRFSHLLYKEFKRLKYREQISEKGFLFLYSAWSHDPHSIAFLKETVRYLERANGESRPPQLLPLYDFAFSKYGSNFSTLEEERKEKKEMELRRKMEEELEAEIREGEKLRLEVGDFKNEQERMDYYLEQAKEIKRKKRRSGVDIKGTTDGVMTFD